MPQAAEFFRHMIERRLFNPFSERTAAGLDFIDCLSAKPGNWRCLAKSDRRRVSFRDFLQTHDHTLPVRPRAMGSPDWQAEWLTVSAKLKT
jgi:hypothetical protein